jgi:hypothetical protein
MEDYRKVLEEKIGVRQKNEIEEALFYTLEKGARGYGLRKRKRNT